ncbi:hypothetical protein [Verrucomicrobium sp. BvORR034]|uniref:hypothetical protein n=1 Tax=Verrucomicrobium sp. BvORR034 TaxID=1396418 RepID=UPI000B20C4EF|nr:hypothetical protein [Verrucomicrobium sp. BvORR034]
MRILPETCRLRQKRQGLTDGEAHFEIQGPLANASSLIAQLPRIGANHPFSSFVKMETRELVYIPNGIRAECRYCGASDEDLDQPVYSLVMGVEEQPIEVHPDFVSQIGGRPSSPLHGAMFVDASGNLTTNDLVGTFAGFGTMVATGPSSFAANPFAGIEAFLDVTAISYRERFVSRNLPSNDVNQVGKIFTALPGPAPGFGNRNWLYVGYQMDQRGSRFVAGVPQTTQRVVYDIVREWRLSGRGGWNPTIYG